MFYVIEPNKGANNYEHKGELHMVFIIYPLSDCLFMQLKSDLERPVELAVMFMER